MQLRFSDEPEIREFEPEHSLGLLYKPYNYKNQGPTVAQFTDTHRRTWIRSAANARRRALDLVEGIGFLGDPEDIYAYHLPRTGENDDRRRPLVWEEDFCLTFTEPDDGMASYGRTPLPHV